MWYVAEIKSLHLTKPGNLKRSMTCAASPRLVAKGNQRGSRPKDVGEQSPSLAWHGSFCRENTDPACPASCWPSTRACPPGPHALEPHCEPGAGSGERGSVLLLPPLPSCRPILLRPSHHRQPRGFLCHILAIEHQSKTVFPSCFFDVVCGLGLSVATCPGIT